MILIRSHSYNIGTRVRDIYNNKLAIQQES